MKGKFLFATGLAAGYVLGSRSGRAAYDKLKARSAELWHSKPVQDKVAAAAETVKDKAPEVSEQLGDAAHGSTSAATQGAATPGTPAPAARDVQTDPALTDQTGQDWSDEGGATPAGPATNVNEDNL